MILIIFNTGKHGGQELSPVGEITRFKTLSYADVYWSSRGMIIVALSYWEHSKTIHY